MNIVTNVRRRKPRMQQKPYGAPPPVSTIEDFCAFNEKTYFDGLSIDIRNAVQDIKLQSPWVTKRRLKPLLPDLEGASKRGITLCCFLREPDWWTHRGNPDLTDEVKADHAEAQELFDELRKIGAHVNLRPAIHEKMATVDNLVLWDGSLNTLSHRNTRDRMTRMVSRHFTMEAIVKHRLDTCADCWNSPIRSSFSSEQANAQLKLIAEQLAATRQDHLSQRALAELVSLDHSVISKLESAHSSINSRALLQITGIMGYEAILIPRVLVPAVHQFVYEKVSNRKYRSRQG